MDLGAKNANQPSKSTNLCCLHQSYAHCDWTRTMITWMEKEQIEHLQLISTIEKLVETPNNLPIEPIECCQQRINYLEIDGIT